MEYGLIGEKLGHSFSKEVHNRLFDYNYLLKEIPKDKIESFLKQKDFKAINVTIPYKQTVIPYLDFISDTASAIGAVNTVVNKYGKLYGYNTDFLGLKALIEKNDITLQGKKVLILGSGGTSKTALAVAKYFNSNEILRVSRRKKDGFITYDEAVKYQTDAQIIINTTPCGMYPDIFDSALDITNFNKLEGVIDAIYNPLNSKLVCDAKAKGIKAVGGLYMLIAQAAFAAEKFTEKTIETEKIDLIYKDLLNRKQNIVLVGMPGSGKTTVGKILAEKLNLEFVDTDDIIVKNHGDITEIFNSSTEKVFRDYEAAAIKDVSALQGKIIATGGGAILRQENVDLLKRNGKIYFLDRPLSDIVATADRPLSSNRADLEKRYNERYDKYLSCADERILVSGTANNVANTILEDILK